MAIDVDNFDDVDDDMDSDAVDDMAAGMEST